MLKSHTNLFVCAVSELADEREEKGLHAQLCAVQTLQHSPELVALPSTRTRYGNLNEAIIPGSQRKPVVALISLEDFEHKVSVSILQHKPVSPADVKIAKWKLLHAASCTMPHVLHLAVQRWHQSHFHSLFSKWVANHKALSWEEESSATRYAKTNINY